MNDDIHDWSGAYALDALDDLERQQFERHLATCPACSADVRAFREVAAELPVAPVDSNAPLRSRVLAEVATTPQLSASEAPRRSRSWPTTIITVAAAFALLAVAGAATLSVVAERRAIVAEERLDSVASVIAGATAVARGETGQGTTVAVVSSPTGTVIFPGPLPALPSDRAYQYWWIVDGEARSLSVGAAGGASAPVLVDEQLAGGLVGITAEPEAGSPQPTMDPLVVVELPTA